MRRGNFLGNNMAAVWIVDDDESIRWVLERALTRQGYQVRAFPGASDCMAALADGTPDAIVSDIRMPGQNGIDLLKRIKDQHAKLPVIIMTAYSDLDSAVSALQGGAFEYLPKPFDVADAIALIGRAVSEAQSVAQPEQEESGPQEILGQAPAMQEVFRAIGRLSNSNVTVLITGESGSGKELVARALHEHSSRSRKSFVALNTAAIPRDLLESELFGHERGAFTGAQQTRVGRFEQAEGGTLFLDEIGDMPAELQTRLLRVLSDGQYYRVGGQQPQRSNVRIIAATHQDLEERVRQGLFREDLFHRLHVIRLRLPSLRERREDIPLLARHFLQKSARLLSAEPKRLGEDAMEAMVAFNWPGNVRQLENVCHWLTVMAPSLMVNVPDLPPELRATSGQPPSAQATADGPVPNLLRGGSQQTIAAATAAVAAAALAGGHLADMPRPEGSTQAPPLSVAEHGDRFAVSGNRNAGQAATGSNATRRILDPQHAIAPVGLPAAMHAAGAALTGEYDTPGLLGSPDWSSLLQREVSVLLDAQPSELRTSGASELMDELTRVFESTIIRTALRHTRGRRIEAALRLGIGRNTITRKIQDLRLEE